MAHRPFNICEVCEKPKHRGADHSKCSRELQRRYAGANERRVAVERKPAAKGRR